MDVTEDEFQALIDVLGKVNYLSTPEGAQQIVEIISEQADLQSDFQVWAGIFTFIYELNTQPCLVPCNVFMAAKCNLQCRCMVMESLFSQ